MKRSLFFVFALLVLSVTSAFGAKNYDNPDTIVVARDGTGEFRSETADINDTINDRIDDMIANKTGSNVSVCSFVDARNTDVGNVQFVITTPAIRVSTVHAEEAAQPESTSILDKIRNLFR